MGGFLWIVEAVQRAAVKRVRAIEYNKFFCSGRYNTIAKIKVSARTRSAAFRVLLKAGSIYVFVSKPGNTAFVRAAPSQVS